MSVLILHRQIKKMISMNKLIPILLLAFISQICYAAGAPDNSNSGVDDKDNHPHKAPQKPSAPFISYNQGVLSISTHNTLYNAEIIIRDINGNIIYDVVDTISNGYVILLPAYVSSKMQSVELIHSYSHYTISVDESFNLG